MTMISHLDFSDEPLFPDDVELVEPADDPEEFGEDDAYEWCER